MCEKICTFGTVASFQSEVTRPIIFAHSAARSEEPFVGPVDAPVVVTTKSSITHALSLIGTGHSILTRRFSRILIAKWELVARRGSS